METILKRIFESSTIKGKKPTQIADLLGVDASAVTRYKEAVNENNDISINVKTLQKFVVNAQITPQELYEIVAGKPAPQARDGTMEAEIDRLKERCQQYQDEVNFLRDMLKRAPIAPVLHTQDSSATHTQEDSKTPERMDSQPDPAAVPLRSG